jgi:hypothetical protein
MRAFRSVALVALLLAAGRTAAQGQSVRGTLVDEGSKQPVAGASVTLLSPQNGTRARTVTDSAGLFSLRTPGGGAYWLRIESLGHATLETRPFVLDRDSDLVLDLATRGEIATLEGVEVQATNRQNRNYATFLERQKFGWGRYLGPKEIEKRNPVYVSDLVVGMVPGLQRDVRTGLVAIAARGRYCIPSVFIDGFRSDPSLDSSVPASSVRAVEVYNNPSFIPTQLQASFNSCGAIALWTDSGLGLE